MKVESLKEGQTVYLVVPCGKKSFVTKCRLLGNPYQRLQRSELSATWAYMVNLWFVDYQYTVLGVTFNKILCLSDVFKENHYRLYFSQSWAGNYAKFCRQNNVNLCSWSISTRELEDNTFPLSEENVASIPKRYRNLFKVGKKVWRVTALGKQTYTLKETLTSEPYLKETLTSEPYFKPCVGLFYSAFFITKSYGREELIRLDTSRSLEDDNIVPNTYNHNRLFFSQSWAKKYHEKCLR